MTRRIVALVDLEDEDSARNALSAAVDHAKHIGARLYVLNVVPDGMIKMSAVAQVIPQDYEQKITGDAKQRLTALVKKHAAKGIDVEPTVRMGSVYKEALDFAQDTGAELIVMGAHKPGMADFLLGSNASQIVRHAKCSVWIVRS